MTGGPESDAADGGAGAADPEDRAVDASADRRGAASVDRLRYAAAGLAFVVAALHLFHPDLGFPRLVRLLAADPALLATHPRPLAFVLSAIAILLGINAVVAGAPRRPIYAGGALLVATYVVGYVAWHYSGHGGFLPGREPHGHGASPVEMVVTHLTGDAWALAAVATELALLALLAALLVADR